ncbi:MAG: glycoside hydrolase family 3 C-terminal domain-containing protein [Ignavibacteria bacterium]|nr:glycoside hydrolase family 3 C-terminal domain-containing protein [Ignavibacteria bacterium]
MKLKIIFFILILSSAVFLLTLLNNNTNSYSTIEVSSQKQIDFKQPASRIVSKKLNEMSLKEKIAQMVISSTVPENFNEDSNEFKKLEKLCSKNKVGGFIFFKGTTTDYARLSNKLQGLSDIPLLISSDFERGIKMRVTDGVLFPNAMAIGAADNPELSYKIGLEIARETRLIGVHQNYSPVCDVNNNPNNPIINVRSFGEDPKLVSRMSQSMIKGLQDGKVIATAKHFPGHGDTEIDSHNDLPMLNFSMDRLSSIELVPFRNAIEHNVMSVMIAHLSFPELESQANIPASLSPNIVQGLLIDKMGFQGLVVTDALNMKGITKYFSTAEVAVMCVNAGIDLILMPLNEETTIDAIEAAVLNGSISAERIDRSAEKILKAKEWLGLFENRMIQDADVYKNINTPEASSLSQQIADESITLVKDENGVLPFRNAIGKSTAVITISEGGEQDNTAFLSSVIPDYFNSAVYFSANTNSADAMLESNIESLANTEQVVIAVYAKVRYGTGKISISQKNIDIINRIKGLNKNIVIISFGNPYLLKEFPEVPAYICAYGDSDVSINAALKAITGAIKFKGKLPVSITDQYKFGAGILK